MFGTKNILMGLQVLAVGVSATGAFALEKKPVLSLEAAEAIANACLAHQSATKYAPINVVVVDDGGNVILSKRQDGSCKACGDIAENKARTSALYNAPTRLFETLSFGEKKDGVAAGLPGAAFVPGLVSFPGGLPLVADSMPIGGVGVSGASGDEDESCAKAGADALEALLKQ
jgi:glc operon protein GlcG